MFSKVRFLALFWITISFFIVNGLQIIFLGSFAWLLALAVAFYALHEGPGFGAFAGAFAGFFLDLYGVGPPGFWIGILAFCGLLTGVVSRKLFRESPLAQFLMGALAVFSYRFLSVLFSTLIKEESLFRWLVIREMFSFQEFFLAMAVSFFYFRFLKNGSHLARQSRYSVFYR